MQSKNDRLAWKVDVGPFTVLVDAATRAVLWTVTSRPEASVVRDARGANEFGYLGYTEVEVDGVPRAGAPTPNADVSSTRLGGGVGASLARMQAMLARNGWLGLNGRGGNLVANTNVNLSGGRCQNAFFDSTFTNSAFFCLGIASADVVGHEFTHGVVAHSSGLLYADQSGAINEAYADLFGNLMDSSPGWLVGEQTTSGALRDMLNPSALGIRITCPGTSRAPAPAARGLGIATLAASIRTAASSTARTPRWPMESPEPLLASVGNASSGWPSSS